MSFETTPSALFDLAGAVSSAGNSGASLGNSAASASSEVAPPAPKHYWRSLDQLEQTPEFNEFVQREFPQAASEFPDGFSRRRWLQLMGASLSLAGAAGCRWEKDYLAPSVTRPQNRIPGVPQQYATAFEVNGFARPLVLTSYDGRPIKVEGNREHPLTKGGTDAIAQASLLNMYDIDRSQGCVERSGNHRSEKSWDECRTAIEGLVKPLAASGGKGLRVLAEASSSPSRARLKAMLAEKYPESKWYEYEPVLHANTLAGSAMAFGKPVRTHLNLDAAQVILAIDDDLFASHPTALANIRGWASNRVPENGSMNRMYAVESQFSSAGLSAEHRLPLKSSAIESFVVSLEDAVDSALAGQPVKADSTAGGKFLSALASDLAENKGKSVVTVGPRQPASVHARVHRINSKLGNFGGPLFFTAETNNDGGTGMLGLKALVAELQGGQVETLVVVGGNPVYNAPADVSFAEAYGKAKNRLHLSDYDDETSRRSTWHICRAHQFECWGDAATYDGRVLLKQPLIEAFFGAKSDLQVLALLAGDTELDGEKIVRETLAAIQPSTKDESVWRKLVHDGFLAAEEPTKVDVALVANLELPPPSPTKDSDLELVLVPHAFIYDGRFANNGWLQETPDFLTKLTWDNAAILAPKTADALGVKTGTLVKLTIDGRSLTAPAYVLPGQAIGSVGLALGYGRAAAGHVGGLTDVDPGSEKIASVGVNSYLVRSSTSPDVALGLKVESLGKKALLATTQDHHALDAIGLSGIAGRIGELIREATFVEYKAHPDFAQHAVHHPPLESLWTERSFENRAWGMAIDLSKCVGCNACITACQAENNVPIVGKEQVAKGREMHWIRVDRYFTGDVDNPQIAVQPVNCMQCENAPCEQVCPVAATVHSQEGLNDMAYNRCIGTRYCGNNCPYKVRRFNFFDYNRKYEVATTDLTKMILNPEVTVRERGVMEKCTYCVQRIQNVKIVAKNENRAIADGEIVTACQQACPAGAIEFGDLVQKDSKVAKAHANPRCYAMLGELNNKPRTQFMAKVTNPHPALAGESNHGHGHGGHHS